MCLLIFILSTCPLNAQIISHFNLTIRNEVQVTDRILEFDLYLQDTDNKMDFELVMIQAGILVNPDIYNGGVILVSLLDNSSDLVPKQQPETANILWEQSSNIIKMTAKLPTNQKEGTYLSQKSPGSRVIRLRISNTVPFSPNSKANLKFSFTWPPFPTKVFQRINLACSEITCDETNCFSVASNIILNPGLTTYNVLGSGIYCHTGDGLPVGLDNSNAGVTYTLFKDAVAQTPVITGTGTAITFGIQTAGIYTIRGSNGIGSTIMTGNAVITENKGPEKPTGFASQSFCSGDTPILTYLTVEGSAIKWFTDSMNGKLLEKSIPLVNGAHYFASQTIDGCESAEKISVAVTINPTPNAPIGSINQTFCSREIQLISNLTATGTEIKWYSTPTGGNSFELSTPLTNNTRYYASQTVNNCESTQRLEVLTNIITAAGPTGIETQSFCSGILPTVDNLTADGNDIHWYSSLNSGIALAESTVLVHGKQYFARQTVDGCESKSSFNVIALLKETPAPTSTYLQSFCSGESPMVANLTATGTAIQWYDDIKDRRGLSGSNALVNGKHYFASQTIDGCESKLKQEVIASFNTTPASPTGNPVQSFVFADSSQIADLSVIGTSVKWYSDSYGEFALKSDVKLTDATPYYASQTVNGCESEERLNITASINAENSVPVDIPEVIIPEPEKPVTPIITKYNETLTSSSNNGNQWYMDGEAIPGENGIELITTREGLYYVVVIQNGISSAPSNSIAILPSVKLMADIEINLYPNPNSGIFKIQIETTKDEIYTIEIFNNMGGLVWKREDVEVNGIYTTETDLTGINTGIYTVAVRNKTTSIVKKVIIMRQ